MVVFSFVDVQCGEWAVGVRNDDLKGPGVCEVPAGFRQSL